MSKIGAVIIANNTDRFDYVKLAAISAGKIKKHLKIPVALITEDTVSNPIFDTVIKASSASTNARVFSRTNEKLDWKNLNRTQAYDLSPWDRTLLLDADYFVNSDSLSHHLNSNFDFAVAKNCYNPMSGDYYVMKMGKSNIEQLWATVIIFNKSRQAKQIFLLAEHVLKHYLYYSKLYGFNSFPYRNDYAFTIACHILGGYGQKNFSLANYSLVNCDFNTVVESIDANSILVSQIENDYKFVQRIKSDVHIQDKISLFGKL